MNTPEKNIRSRDITVSGYRLRLYESGDPASTPVLWLHGSGPGVNALANWEHLIADLAPSYYNIAPDIIGFGDSDYPDPFPRGLRASCEFRADVTLALLEQLGVGRAHVVGNSMGGMITLMMAQKAPKRLDRLVFMGSGGAGGLTPLALELMKQFSLAPTHENMSNMLGAFIYDFSAFSEKFDDMVADRLAKALRPEVVRVNTATFDWSKGLLVFQPDELAKITNEALVLHGREDKVVPVDGSYYLSTHLPNAQLHVLPHCGHWAQVEQHTRFKRLVESFFNERA